MLFINWRGVGFIAVGVMLSVLPLVLCYLHRNRKLLVKIIVAMVATPVSIIGAGFTLMMLFFWSVDRDNHSEAIYSPDHHAAVRAEYWGGFGNTGGTNVVLYRYRGFSERIVFTSVEDITKDQIVWKGNDALQISYTDDPRDVWCGSSKGVHVTCVQQ